MVGNSHYADMLIDSKKDIEEEKWMQESINSVDNLMKIEFSPQAIEGI